MLERIKILMVDDHPIIIEGYQNTLLLTKKESQDLVIDIANNCDQALMRINNATNAKDPYHVLLLDLSIPASKNGAFTSGEDLALYARKNIPNAKVVILTMFNEPYRIHSIINNINPEGFLIKSDLTSSQLSVAFQAVLNKPPFYSDTVNTTLKKAIESNIVIDEKNRKILNLLSQGIKTKNLVGYLDLSLSAIEKRKKQLKVLFCIDDGQDETLLKEARKNGFV